MGVRKARMKDEGGRLKEKQKAKEISSFFSFILPPSAFILALGGLLNAAS
jgi:hypothetical protein